MNCWNFWWGDIISVNFLIIIHPNLTIIITTTTITSFKLIKSYFKFNPNQVSFKKIIDFIILNIRAVAVMVSVIIVN